MPASVRATFSQIKQTSFTKRHCLFLSTVGACCMNLQATKDALRKWPWAYCGTIGGWISCERCLVPVHPWWLKERPCCNEICDALRGIDILSLEDLEGWPVGFWEVMQSQYFKSVPTNHVESIRAWEYLYDDPLIPIKFDRFKSIDNEIARLEKELGSTWKSLEKVAMPVSFRSTQIQYEKDGVIDPLNFKPPINRFNETYVEQDVEQYPDTACAVWHKITRKSTIQWITCAIKVHESWYLGEEQGWEDWEWQCDSWEIRGPAIGAESPWDLCSYRQGAQKPAVDADGQTSWCHVFWLKNIPYIEKIEDEYSIAHMVGSQWRLTCHAWGKRQGAWIGCQKCKRAYHATCGRQFIIEPYVLICPQHLKPFDLTRREYNARRKKQAKQMGHFQALLDEDDIRKHNGPQKPLFTIQDMALAQHVAQLLLEQNNKSKTQWLLPKNHERIIPYEFNVVDPSVVYQLDLPQVDVLSRRYALFLRPWIEYNLKLQRLPIVEYRSSKIGKSQVSASQKTRWCGRTLFFTANPLAPQSPEVKNLLYILNTILRCKQWNGSYHLACEKTKPSKSFYCKSCEANPKNVGTMKIKKAKNVIYEVKSIIK